MIDYILLSQLSRQLDAAIKAGDYDKVRDLQKRIEEVKKG